MRRLLLLSLLPAALMAGCAANPKPERPAMMVGGYGPANLDDVLVKQAEDFAIAELYKRFPSRATVEKVTAESQIVAGANYHFHIKMSGFSGHAYDVLVFRSLQGELTLKDIQKTK